MMVGEGGEHYVGGSFHGPFFHGGRTFSMKRAPDFPVLLKDDQKLNNKRNSTESKEQH